MKTCTKCQEAKPLSEYYKHPNTQDGLFGKCKACVSAYNKRRYEADPEGWREFYRDRYAANRERELARTRARSNGGRDPERPWPTNECTYHAAHHRVKAVYGRASNRDCIDCGKQAQDWSYRGGAEVELMGMKQTPKGDLLVPYSPNPDDYDPRCKPCHAKYDRKERVSA